MMRISSGMRIDFGMRENVGEFGNRENVGEFGNGKEPRKKNELVV